MKTLVKRRLGASTATNTRSNASVTGLGAYVEGKQTKVRSKSGSTSNTPHYSLFDCWFKFLIFLVTFSTDHSIKNDLKTPKLTSMKHGKKAVNKEHHTEPESCHVGM